MKTKQLDILNRLESSQTKHKRVRGNEENSPGFSGRTQISRNTFTTYYTSENQKTKLSEDEIHHKHKLSVSNAKKDNDKFKSKLSWTADIIIGSLLAIFCFVSFLGNTCAPVVFIFRQDKLGSAELFFVNLAIVDILLSIASYPMPIVAAFNHRWDFGEIGCTTYGFTCYFLGVASICSVTAIAVIRYLKTCNLAKGTQITCQRSRKIIALEYVVALVWAGLPLVGFGNYEVEPYGLSCALNWKENDIASQIYIILVTIFLVIIPFITILFCHIQIIRTVKRSDFVLQKSGVKKRNKKRSDVQLTLVSILVSTGFVVAWGPYAIVSLYSSVWGQPLLPVWAAPIPVLLAKSSIAFNPFIYVFFTGRYRNDLVNLAKRWFHRFKPLNQSPIIYVKNEDKKIAKHGNDCDNIEKEMENDLDDFSDRVSSVTRQIATIPSSTPVGFSLRRSFRIRVVGEARRHSGNRRNGSDV